MSMLKMCLNPKVLAGLAVAGLVILAIDPGLFVAALPLLILAVCPLSMLLMGKMMMGTGQASTAGAAGAYTCPMHPDVRSDQPGKCPQCGMALVGAPKETAVARGESVEELRARLERMSADHAALAKEVERLRGPEADEESASKAVAEAEEIARASRDGR